MENKFYQKTQLTTITAVDWQSEHEIEKDRVRVIKTKLKIRISPQLELKMNE